MWNVTQYKDQKKKKAYLPTLPVFPVEYRITGPATRQPDFLWFLPDFNQPGSSVQRNWIRVGARPETDGKMKMKAIHIMTASLRSVPWDVVESTMSFFVSVLTSIAPVFLSKTRAVSELMAERVK